MTQTILRSKKSTSTTNFSVCNMERHEAGQEEKLVETGIQMDSLEGVHQPRDAGTVDHRRCYECVVALVAVMGLVIVTLVLGFVFHYFMFLPSCKQDAPPLGGTRRVNITCKLNETNEKGRYDIFTVNKAATYLVYGWVKLTNITSEEVIFRITYKQDNRTIQKKESKSILFFSDEVRLINNNRISIYFNSSCTDSLFHVLEL